MLEKLNDSAFARLLGTFLLVLLLQVAQLHVEAAFVLPEAARLQGEPQWAQATIALGIADPKAIRAASGVTAGDQRAAWEPGPGDLASLVTGLHAPVPAVRAGVQLPVSFDLTLGGNGRLAVVPVGDETSVYLASPWADPSFDGATLPVSRSVTPSGFEATWRVLNLGRNVPSSWTEEQVQRPQLDASAFGVSLLSPVDTYRTNERAVKYQLLFLGLTFLCFALVELLCALRVHPLQYLLVGLALCLFYLLLLSLSEQVGFSRAYAIAALATVGLVTMYVRFILDSASRAALLGGILSALYGFLFVLLQIQDYALLAGSVGLFAVLGAVMWITRKVDWFALRPARS